MKNKIVRIKNWYKNAPGVQKVLAVFLLFAFVLAIFSILGGNKEEIVTETVKRQDLTRTILATGKIVSSTDLSLSFQKGDIVRDVYVKEGQVVRKGQVLAVLNQEEELANVTSAKGVLLSAEAKYRKVLEGESSEEIRLAEVKVENARRKLYSDDLVAEPDLEDSSSEDPIISGTYNGTQTGEYRVGFLNFPTNEARFRGLEDGKVEVSVFPKPLGVLGLKIQFPGQNYSTQDSWKIKIPNTGGANYTTNLNSYSSAKAELDIKKTKTKPVDVDIARAEVVSAEGNFSSAQAELEKTILRAPSDGTITRVDIKVGEVVEAFKEVMVLQDVSNLYIEANVNESNIAFIASNQNVKITYDAFGASNQYTARVTTVNPSADVVDGIVNYKIKALINNVTNIRPGMTANLSIETAFLPNVLVIPTRAVYEDENNIKTVTIFSESEKNKKQKRVINTGLKGDGGLVEVVSGLSEGEKVLVETN